jgi:hypothetical protein
MFRVFRESKRTPDPLSDTEEQLFITHFGRQERLQFPNGEDYRGACCVYVSPKGIVSLRSWNTIVCQYDMRTHRFRRTWGGYSKSTADHVKLFIRTWVKSDPIPWGYYDTWKRAWGYVPVQKILSSLT